ncbi:hypothetical protein THAOC_18238 [Thalassiosira oceanica]|uniref:Protein ENHANCED DISEASE RESISTANCE 2 C-terminal domain-containing protein n=1 Tax=Thalassiosira oceanica TaxID=159749 RepID=K0S8Q1_THAOC|nr:hypothetical protein THAOC_18238 [Thalassiosira oceanica]|eukprot:EJK61304.1 hypothetical protein THAOC_18238 [Thalassiosira oceanica]
MQRSANRGKALSLKSQESLDLIQGSLRSTRRSALHINDKAAAQDKGVGPGPSAAEEKAAYPVVETRTLERFPDGAPLGSHLNMFSAPPASNFRVRGPDYLADRRKVPSADYPFDLRGCDLFLTDDPPTDIGRHPSLLAGRLRDVPTMIVSFRLPWGVFLSYYAIPDRFLPLSPAGCRARRPVRAPPVDRRHDPGGEDALRLPPGRRRREGRGFEDRPGGGRGALDRKEGGQRQSRAGGEEDADRVHLRSPRRRQGRVLRDRPRHRLERGRPEHPGGGQVVHEGAHDRPRVRRPGQPSRGPTGDDVRRGEDTRDRPPHGRASAGVRQGGRGARPDGAGGRGGLEGRLTPAYFWSLEAFF